MRTNEEKRYAIYSRKSRYTGKGESIENQIELCRRYVAVQYGQRQADEALVYEDEGFSGGSLDRPGFKRMMEDSLSIPMGAIVVYRLDRISRSIEDFSGLIRELDGRGIGFISVREQFDTSSPMGRAMMYIASVFSQLERETIGERIRDNMQELAKTGRWLGGNTPMGFASESLSHVTSEGKLKRACMLRSIPEEQSLVELIFRRFLETGSLIRVEEQLAQGGYITRRGKPFTRFSLKGILSNPVYMRADEAAYRYFLEGGAGLFSSEEDFDGEHGMMTYNRTLQRPGKTTRERPMEEWIVSVGGHRGLIPGEEWIQVQRLLAGNRSGGHSVSRGRTALLSGILFCGGCGGVMRPKLSERRGGAGEPGYIYLCTTKEASHGRDCSMRNLNGGLLDAELVEAMRPLFRPTSEGLARLAQLREGCEEMGLVGETARVRGELAEVERDIRALPLSLERTEDPEVVSCIRSQLDRLRGEAQGMRRQLEVLEADASRQELTEEEMETLRRRLSDMGEVWESFAVEQKRRLIRALVERVVWDGEQVHLYPRGGEEASASAATPLHGERRTKGEDSK